MLHKRIRSHYILLAHGSPVPLWKNSPSNLFYITIYSNHEREIMRSLAIYWNYLTLTRRFIALLDKDVRSVAGCQLFLAVAVHLRQDYRHK